MFELLMFKLYKKYFLIPKDLNTKRNYLKSKIIAFFVRIIGLEPTRLAAPDPKSGMSTNFTISANCECKYKHNY